MQLKSLRCLPPLSLSQLRNHPALLHSAQPCSLSRALVTVAWPGVCRSGDISDRPWRVDACCDEVVSPGGRCSGTVHDSPSDIPAEDGPLVP